MLDSEFFVFLFDDWSWCSNYMSSWYDWACYCGNTLKVIIWLIGFLLRLLDSNATHHHTWELLEIMFVSRILLDSSENWRHNLFIFCIIGVLLRLLRLIIDMLCEWKAGVLAADSGCYWWPGRTSVSPSRVLLKTLCINMSGICFVASSKWVKTTSSA